MKINHAHPRFDPDEWKIVGDKVAPTQTEFTGEQKEAIVRSAERMDEDYRKGGWWEINEAPVARKLTIRTETDGATREVSMLLGTHPKRPIRRGRIPLNVHYADMPEFVQEEQQPDGLFVIETNKSSEDLSRILGQKITDKTKSVWFPKRKRGLGNWAWVDESGLKPRCPIYIISKGRPRCITARALEKMNAEYHICVEPNEVRAYRERWGSRVITGGFDTTTMSSIPVRNWVDGIATNNRYWLMDDNIEDFNILNRNQKYVSRTSVIFRATEDFVSRFSNIGQAGLNYYSFAKKTSKIPPYYINKRIYSCSLMYRNVGGVRVGGKLWRGRYNEDTDLSLRILKAGYCSVLMNAFLAGKVTTQRMRGGNTDSVYVDDDERKRFAESLSNQHPDCVRVVRRFGRWHHLVDYGQFNQELKQIDYQPVDYRLKLDPNGR